MKTLFLKIFIPFFSFLVGLSLTSYAQTDYSKVELEGGSNKLFVVIGVLLIIFIGIVIYLFSLDKKIKALKKKIDS